MHKENRNRIVWGILIIGILIFGVIFISQFLFEKNESNSCLDFAQNQAIEFTNGFQVTPTDFFVVSSHYSSSQGLCYYVLHNQTIQNTSEFGQVTFDYYDLYSNNLQSINSYTSPSSEIISCQLGNSQSGMSSKDCKNSSGLNVSYTDYQSIVQTDMNIN
jgi:hypothetical protein